MVDAVFSFRQGFPTIQDVEMTGGIYTRLTSKPVMHFSLLLTHPSFSVLKLIYIILIVKRVDIIVVR
jgi:hypothetical protein